MKTDNTQYAPGEWEYTKEDQRVYVAGDYSKMIADIRGWGWIQKLPNGEAVQDYHGTIIAAAPKMLEDHKSDLLLMEDLIKRHRNGEATDPWYFIKNLMVSKLAIIAQAEGKTNK